MLEDYGFRATEFIFGFSFTISAASDPLLRRSLPIRPSVPASFRWTYQTLGVGCLSLPEKVQCLFDMAKEEMALAQTCIRITLAWTDFQGFFDWWGCTALGRPPACMRDLVG